MFRNAHARRIRPQFAPERVVRPKADMQRRTALVTGASYGVGAATALALARDGFDVAVSATSAENLDGTLAKLEALGAPFIIMDRVAGGSPRVDRAGGPEAFDCFDRAVERNPHHHFRMGEMPTFSADLPDAVVRRPPDLFEMGDKGTLKIPSFGEILNIADTCQVQRVHDFTKNVDL